MTASIRILLVEDHAIVREGLRSLLESQEGIAIVAEAEDGRKALAMVEKVSPNVVVMDINLPELNGIETTRKILEIRPATQIIGLSVHMQAQFVSELIRAGATGYVPKKCAARELLTAIQAVMAGNMYISPEVTEQIMDRHVRRPVSPSSTAFSKLTSREREVLQLLAEGKSVKETAVILSLSAPTVHTHRQSIMRKLNQHSIAELTKYAIRQGLTSLDIP
jgi:DNA-binding NarL/FixJ family response regulator